jgi:osmotically-inducible protein OsmY
MRDLKRTFVAAAMLLAASGGMTGCVTAVARVGTAAFQERSMSDAAKDAAIGTKINAELMESDAQLFAKTGVDVVEGRVLLTGVLRNKAAKIDAGRIAHGVSGVREVMNEIEVRDKGEDIIDLARDTRMSGELHVRLIGDEHVANVNYTVETVDRVIYLLGIARDNAELERVIGHARSIDGVRNVVSLVVTKDDPRRRRT